MQPKEKRNFKMGEKSTDSMWLKKGLREGQHGVLESAKHKLVKFPQTKSLSFLPRRHTGKVLACIAGGPRFNSQQGQGIL